jgi:hypothetical protein
VFGLKAIDGHHDVELFVPAPFRRDGAEGAGDDLGVDSAALDLGQEQLQFTIANEGIATDQGDVERLELVDEGEDAGDQLFSAEVGELTEDGFAAQVGGVKGVAAGTAQGTFLGDFDGKRRGTARKNPGPGMENF